MRLWSPFVAESLTALQQENKLTKRSLGIVKPDSGSVRFKVKPLSEAEEEEQEIATQVYEQASLLEESLKPLPRPEYSFSYHFTSDGKAHACKIHDWEIQAAYINYRVKYGKEAMSWFVEMYEKKIVENNLHLIMGTMQKRHWQFIIIGLLRSSVDPEKLKKQPDLFS